MTPVPWKADAWAALARVANDDTTKQLANNLLLLTELRNLLPNIIESYSELRECLTQCEPVLMVVAASIGHNRERSEAFRSMLARIEKVLR